MYVGRIWGGGTWIMICVIVFILPGHEESKLLKSKQPRDLSEGVDNEKKIAFAMALLLLPADLDLGPHGWELMGLSFESWQLLKIVEF